MRTCSFNIHKIIKNLKDKDERIIIILSFYHGYFTWINNFFVLPGIPKKMNYIEWEKARKREMVCWFQVLIL